MTVRIPRNTTTTLKARSFALDNHRGELQCCRRAQARKLTQTIAITSRNSPGTAR